MTGPRPARRGPLSPGTILVAGAVVLAVPTVAVGVFAADGEHSFQDLMTMFVLILVASGAGATTALLFGRRLLPAKAFTSDAGASAEVREALRAGRTDDPRVDARARTEARRRLDQRWHLWFLVAGVLVEVLLLVSAVRASTRVAAVVLILLWTGAAWFRGRGLREARRYLAEPAERP